MKDIVKYIYVATNALDGSLPYLLVQFGIEDAWVHNIFHQLPNDGPTHQNQTWIGTNGQTSWLEYLHEQVELEDQWLEEKCHWGMSYQGKYKRWQFLG